MRTWSQNIIGVVVNSHRTGNRQVALIYQSTVLSSGYDSNLSINFIICTSRRLLCGYFVICDVQHFHESNQNYSSLFCHVSYASCSTLLSVCMVATWNYLRTLVSSTRWRHDMETFSVLLDFVGVTACFPVHNEEQWCLLWSYLDQALEWTAEMRWV